MTARLQQPTASRSATSFHDSESEYAQLIEENPLDVTPWRQQSPNPSHTGNQLEMNSLNQNVEEPPPPYQEMASELPATLPVELPIGRSNNHNQFSTIEYSPDNSPQLLVHNTESFPPPPPRNPARLNSGTGEVRSNLSPAPLRLRNEPSRDSLQSVQRKPLPPSRGHSQVGSFSSSKAREAGFEIEQPRTGSASREPSVTILPSSNVLTHTRELGKVTAYLVPFPKPRIKGVKPEDIPDRFLIYTPPLPPLLKPAPGEKETHWHKTQRQWQEETRKATIQRASKSSWQGLKAGTSNLVQKGVNKTKSTSLEFLERASGDMETLEPADESVKTPDDKATEADQTSQPRTGAVELPTEAPTLSTAELPADMPSSELRPDSAPVFSNTTNTPINNARKSKSKDKDKNKDTDSTKPKGLSDLTLIYPPSLALTPEQIRTEFSETLIRTATSSRKDALLASTLVPLAAGLDATLIFTLGGFTQMTSAWAYTSTRGALESRKMTRAISRGNLLVRDDADDAASTTSMKSKEGEDGGAAAPLGNKDGGGGGSPQSSTTTLSTTTATAAAASASPPTPTSTPMRPPFKKDKEKFSSFSKIYPSSRDEKPKPSTCLHLQQSPHISVFQRYLDLACLKASFALFPHVEEVSDDVNESSVLDAIGWKPSPVMRAGGGEKEGDGVVDGGNGGLTTAEDERYQREEAREDVKRMVRKGAAEWVTWCKGFAKESAGGGEKKGGK
ncbi:hypothetical protein DM02DRAFT_609123 [Periconia macrospinosa]|uniref:Uncharacterized protein n=1 Tax=Periconia macrospinosa TaxID=97972 RepID=A0A2V1EBT9_9PLEO|nr:hypothetical protein DM02DRAFT_609123 [Periconia macrospinosa]